MKTSVIIPTFNRYASLVNLVESLEASGNRTLQDVEILVIDDGSTDVTSDTKSIGSADVIRKTNSGAAASRNFGAAAATGDILLFVDDDCEVDPGILDEIARSQWARQACYFPKVLPRVHGKPDWIERYLSFRGFPSEPWFGRDGNLICMPTPSFLIHRDDYESIGGFDEAFAAAGGEDDVFTMKLVSKDFQIERSDSLIVYHDNRCDLVTFWRRHFNYGRGHEIICKKFGGDRSDYELEFEGIGELVFYLPLLLWRHMKSFNFPELKFFILLTVQLFAIKLGALTEQWDRR